MNQTAFLGRLLSIRDFKRPLGKGLEHFHSMVCSTDIHADFVAMLLIGVE